MIAVRRLRKYMGLSQQAFAGKLKLAVRTIAKYEADGEPEPEILARLAVFARKHSLDAPEDLAGQFRCALEKRLPGMTVHFRD